MKVTEKSSKVLATLDTPVRVGLTSFPIGTDNVYLSLSFPTPYKLTLTNQDNPFAADILVEPGGMDFIGVTKRFTEFPSKKLTKSMILSQFTFPTEYINTECGKFSAFFMTSEDMAANKENIELDFDPRPEMIGLTRSLIDHYATHETTRMIETYAKFKMKLLSILNDLLISGQ